MTGSNWSHRVSPRNSPQDLQDVRNAAREFGDEARRVRGQSGLVFQQVSQYVILASVAATPSLAFYHLWEKLSRSHDAGYRHHDRQDHEDQPPRRHSSDDDGAQHSTRRER